ncbi:MAG: ABC transporter permease [Lachnospiraceae bacterium]|nr:ABC transporter permease [Lachnospiraceae bacterium]
MREVLKKSKMLICILSLSINVFIVAFSAMLLPKYEKEKDAIFLSDEYYIITFLGNNPSVEEVRKVVKEYYKYFVVNFAWSQCKAIEFSTKQMEDIGIKWKTKNWESEEIAVVNKDYGKICIETSNEKYIMILGNEYKVVEYFEDKNDDLNKITKCYVNLNSLKMMQCKEYDCIFLDLKAKSDREVIDRLEEEFENIKISKWSGHRFQEYNVRGYMSGVIILCGGVVFLNCIIFVRTWVEKQHKELNIRIKIGATTKKNRKLLCNRIVIVYFISGVVGILLSELEIMILNRVPWLCATRELLGTKIYIETIVISFVVVFFMTIFITNIQFMSFNRREQKSNV